jgi:hypothetical protein
MRQADREEADLHHFDPADGLQRSVDASVEAWTVEVNGTPAALFGLARGGAGKGMPWLLATDLFVTAWMGVARRARRIVQTWARYAPLENWCDPRNEVALRFLEWLGFEVEPVKGRTLARFWMPRHGGR